MINLAFSRTMSEPKLYWPADKVLVPLTARAPLEGMLGTGIAPDQAFLAVLGVDTDGVDRAVREAILAEFPSGVATEVPHRASAKLREATP